MPDKYDNRIIRFTNLLILCTNVCEILRLPCAEHMEHLAHCVFMATVGCMSSQINVSAEIL